MQANAVTEDDNGNNTTDANYLCGSGVQNRSISEEFGDCPFCPNLTKEWKSPYENIDFEHYGSRVAALRDLVWEAMGGGAAGHISPATPPPPLYYLKKGQALGQDPSPIEIASSLSNIADSITSTAQDVVSIFAVEPSHRILIDSAASDCITSLGQALKSFTPQSIRLELAAKGNHSVATGQGQFKVRFHGEKFDSDYNVPQVIHDPDSRHTLLATAALQDIGIGTSFPNDITLCILTDRGGREICRGHRVGKTLYEMPISVLYPDTQEYSAKILSVETSSVLHHALAHLRLGHVNDHDLKSVVKLGKLDDVNVGDLKESLFCFGCKLGKATRLPYTLPPREKVTNPGGRVHIDIWGPV